MPAATVVARHRVVTYTALTFAISWGGVLLTVGPRGFPGTVEQFGALLLPVVLAMLAGPSLAALIVVGVVEGGPGLREMGARVVTLRVGLRWYAAAIVTAPVIVVSTLLVLSALSPEFRPGLLSADDPGSHLLIGVVTGAAAGLFEELGWTAVAVRHLRSRHGVLATGLVVGVIWSAWHLLVVWWGSTSTVGETPLALYLPVMTLSFLPPYRVLMVWVYDRTRSVGVAMLMHASLTASVRIFDPLGIAGASLLTYNLAVAVLLWLVVAALAGRRRLTAEGMVPERR